MVHGDCYVTIIIYLHRTPAYPSLWNSVCYTMITVDHGSTSTIRQGLKSRNGLPKFRHTANQETRLHSSRMRTARLGGCGCLPGGGGVCLGGCLSRGRGACLGLYTPIACWDTHPQPMACWDTPPPCEQSHRQV